MAESFPGVEHTLSEDGLGGPPGAGVVLGKYETRVIDMASAYATIAASGIYHRPHFVEKVVNAQGEVLLGVQSTLKGNPQAASNSSATPSSAKKLTAPALFAQTYAP